MLLFVSGTSLGRWHLDSPNLNPFLARLMMKITRFPMNGSKLQSSSQAADLVHSGCGQMNGNHMNSWALDTTKESYRKNPALILVTQPKATKESRLVRF
jgi:hypothetical protein